MVGNIFFTFPVCFSASMLLGKYQKLDRRGYSIFFSHDH